jgi:hypothetical protein
MMVYLSANWMVHEVPRVEVEAEDHVAWGEVEVVARSHVLAEMVQDHGEEGEGNDDQKFPLTHQSDCGHNNHHRNYPVNTKHPMSIT